MNPIPNVVHAETGRSLGYDLYVYRGAFDATQSPNSVREGFAQAAAHAPRRKTPDRFGRKWLQLRCNAYARGRAFDERITPAVLQAMDVAECPVTRVALTHGQLLDSDWSVDRLNNDAGYAANNLAVMSVRANKAKGRRGFDEVFALAQAAVATDGLQPAEWLRLAALMLGPCFAEAPQRAPLLAHVVPVSSHRLLLAAQQIQHVFCTQAASQAGKNRLVKAMRVASGSDGAAWRLCTLADRVHDALKGLDRACDVWLEPGVMDAFVRWREAHDDAAWARAAELSRRLAGGRPVASSRLQSWHLGSRGYAH